MSQRQRRLEFFRGDSTRREEKEEDPRPSTSTSTSLRTSREREDPNPSISKETLFAVLTASSKKINQNFRYSILHNDNMKTQHFNGICYTIPALVVNKGYRNFWTFTRTADYPQWSIFVVRGKKFNRLPTAQNLRKSCYRIIGITTHKLGPMNILWFCLQSRRSIAFSAKNWLLIMQP